jgi:hypothetical protein
MAIDNRYDGLDKRVGELEKDIKRIERRQPPAGFPFDAIAKLAAPKPENWLKQHPYLVTIAALVIGIIGGNQFLPTFFSLAVDERINTKLKGPLDELHQTQIKMEGISSKLDTFIDLEKDRLKKLSALSIEQFQRSLPEVSKAIEDASVLKIAVPSDLIGSIRKKLILSDDKQPAYWQAAAAFVNYESMRRVPRLNSAQIQSLSPCMGFVGGGKGTISGLNIDPGEAYDCTVALDGVNLVDSVIRNSVVVFLGKHVKLRNVSFVNCYFVVLLSQSPPVSAQQFAKALLNSDNPVVTLTG